MNPRIVAREVPLRHSTASVATKEELNKLFRLAVTFSVVLSTGLVVLILLTFEDFERAFATAAAGAIGASLTMPKDSGVQKAVVVGANAVGGTTAVITSIATGGIGFLVLGGLALAGALAEGGLAVRPFSKRQHDLAALARHPALKGFVWLRLDIVGWRIEVDKMVDSLKKSAEEHEIQGSFTVLDQGKPKPREVKFVLALRLGMEEPGVRLDIGDDELEGLSDFARADISFQQADLLCEWKTLGEIYKKSEKAQNLTSAVIVDLSNMRVVYDRFLDIWDDPMAFVGSSKFDELQQQARQAFEPLARAMLEGSLKAPNQYGDRVKELQDHIRRQQCLIRGYQSDDSEKSGNWQMPRDRLRDLKRFGRRKDQPTRLEAQQAILEAQQAIWDEVKGRAQVSAALITQPPWRVPLKQEHQTELNKVWKILKSDRWTPPE